METDEFVAAGTDPRGWLRTTVGYRTTRETPGDHRGLPSPSLTFIVTFDEPVAMSDPADARSFDVLLAGVSMEAETVRMPRVQTGIQTAIHPLAARAVFGVPAAELRERSVHGEDVLGSVAGHLREQLATTPGWEERFRILARHTAHWARAHASSSAPRPEVSEAWRILEASRGRCRIDRLAEHVHLSRRRLSTVFAAELGVSPKQAARTMRFTHAIARIRRGVLAGSLDLAEIAAHCGYADQSHLAREFRSFVGIAPSSWIDEEFPNIQAGGHSYAQEWAT